MLHSDIAARNAANAAEVPLHFASMMGTLAPRKRKSGIDSKLKAIASMAGYGVKSVNSCLSGPYIVPLDQGIGTAVAHGMTITAAGNEGPAANPHFPAAVDYMAGAAVVVRRSRSIGWPCRALRVSPFRASILGLLVAGPDCRAG